MSDWNVIRELALRVAEIASLPEQQETIRLWKALNRLQPERPMVRVNHVPWHEMDVDGELTLLTQDPFHRWMETELRRTLYAWRHIRVDMVVEPFLRIPKVIHGVAENLGIEPLEQKIASDEANPIVSHHYSDLFCNDDNLERIQVPEVWLDEKATTEREERACDLLADILPVRMEGHCPRFTPWDRIIEWRGAQKTLISLIDEPEFMHRLMRRVTDAYLGRLARLEAQGLLGFDQAIVKNSGAHTDELPRPGFDLAHPRACDIWSSGMAQVFASASPAMHEEFEIQYAIEWYKHFGLNYYGCCEPLDDRIDLVTRIPRVRKISMSPWTNQERGAAKIGDRYVFSRKPNPALLVGDGWNPERVRADLQETLNICRRHGCPCEFILQDVSTVARHPERLWQWCDIAMEVANDHDRE